MRDVTKMHGLKVGDVAERADVSVQLEDIDGRIRTLRSMRGALAGPARGTPSSERIAEALLAAEAPRSPFTGGRSSLAVVPAVPVAALPKAPPASRKKAICETDSNP